MSESKKINRREFIGASAAIAGLTIVPRSVLGGKNYTAPSDKINVAYIGTGSQGIRVLMEFLRHPEIQITTICDANRDSQDYPEWNKNEVRNSVRRFLDEPTWGEGNTGCRGGREVGKEIAELYYGKNKPSEKYTGIKTYEDFRELLAKEKDIDGVCVMTPEHTHATIAIAAMKQGKHVINHKPISNVLSEVGLATKTAA
jgi:predicted dehydrogenase